MATLKDSTFELSGEIIKIVFKKEETGFTIASILPDENPDDLFNQKREAQTISGVMPGIQAGSHVKIIGEHTTHPKFGQQIKVLECINSAPTTEAGIENYLSSGVILGIGKHYARKIVQRFGVRTIDILNDDPRAIMAVPGIGETRAQRIADSWAENKAINDIMMKLQSFDISTAYAMRIFKYYGEKACEVISRNPYQLAMDINGIGFKKADAIARKNGYDLQSVQRAEAGILYALDEASGKGNTYLPMNDLVSIAQELLSEDEFVFSEEKITESITNLQQKEMIINEDNRVFLTRLFNAETLITEKLLEIKEDCFIEPAKASEKIVAYGIDNKIAFASEQENAIRNLVTLRGVHILTGGPGTGKTTMVKAVISILSDKNILLAAPTGRAAKRMSETTGREAKTIHRLLKFNPQFGGFEHDEKNPLCADLIILDESSMLDVQLAASFLKAVHPNTGIIFVGDIDQLPSVGPGNVLRDLIDSRQFHVHTLQTIFRQAGKSMIVSNAHRINKGIQPAYEPDQEQNQDFYFVQADEPEEALARIVNLAEKWISEKFGFDRMKDVQVLAPMHKGVIGVGNLNSSLQNVLNPKGKEFSRGFLKIRVGDKVIQTKNNYEKDAFNGDVGFVESIDEEDGIIQINYDGRTVDYKPADLDEVQLAYAISIHKSQGSEYPAVIIPVHTQHFVMLQRNLIYTGITRGKKLVCLVGTKKAIGMAVKNDQIKQRYSALKSMLIADDMPF